MLRLHRWTPVSRLERIEVEANEFSAALLMQGPEFKAERRRLGGGCDVSHIRHLAELFDVSQEMMAQIYVQAPDEKVAVIISHKGEARRVIPQQGFPYLGLKKGVPIPPKAFSRAFSIATADDHFSALQEILTDIWLDRRGTVSAIYEQVFVQEGGWAMTPVNGRQLLRTKATRTFTHLIGGARRDHAARRPAA